jgi:hypothetical protein
MAIQSASAKLYTGIRCWCVDKNISASLSSSFSIGNKNRPIQVSGDIVYPNVLPFKLVKFIIDVETKPSVALANNRYKTYGGGNNVITPGSPRVIDDTNNWKVVSSLVCKFPTYFRIDVEKLQLPEGTTCTVSFEEGWITEGDFKESTHLPSPKVDNFFTFRTPWFGLSFMKSNFTMPNTFRYRIRPAASTMGALFSPSISAKISRKGVIDLQTAFGLVTKIGKKQFFTANAASAFTAIFGNVKIMQLASTNNNLVSSLATDFEIVQDLASTSISASSSMSIEAVRYPGLYQNIAAVSSLTAQGVNKTSGIDFMASSGTLSIQPSIIRRGDALFTAVANTTVIGTQTLAVPRWREIFTSSTVGNYIYPSTDASRLATVNFDGTVRLYDKSGNSYVQNGSTINIGFGLGPQKIDFSRDFSIAAYTDSTSSFTIRTISTGATTTVSRNATTLGIKKSSGGTVIIGYDGNNSTYRYFSSTGSESIFSNMTSSNAPHSIAVSSNSTSGSVMFVGLGQDNNLFLWNNQGAATKQIISCALSYLSVCRISDDGTLFVVSNPTDKTVKVFKRSGTANTTTTLVQTITGTATGFGESMDLTPDGSLLTVGKDYFIRSGDTFIQWRSVDNVNPSYAYDEAFKFAGNTIITAIRNGDTIVYYQYY